MKTCRGQLNIFPQQKLENNVTNQQKVEEESGGHKTCLKMHKLRRKRKKKQ